jgi:hypothetical protein
VWEEGKGTVEERGKKGENQEEEMLVVALVVNAAWISHC